MEGRLTRGLPNGNVKTRATGVLNGSDINEIATEALRGAEATDECNG